MPEATGVAGGEKFGMKYIASCVSNMPYAEALTCDQALYGGTRFNGIRGRFGRPMKRREADGA